MASRRLIVALCLMGATYTFCVSSFPVLLPEVGAALRMADWQLGIVAGAFGLARMVTDIPAGLIVTHHVRRALVSAPVFMILGTALIVSAGGVAWLLLGQILLSIGYTLGQMASVTIILRERPGSGLVSALNAFELSAMTAVLGAVTLVGLFPRTMAWNVAYLFGCVPIIIGLAALQRALAMLPPTDATRPWFARIATEPAPSVRGGGGSATVALAFAAGGAIALTYTTVASFLVPLRGNREFGLDRAGISQLLMLAQACDIVALLPVGALADARGTRRVLAGVLFTIAAALSLIGFGALPHVVAGCVLFGLGMAGWMLPLGLLRSATPASRIAWRTALYRVGVDGGMFLGPFLSGMLSGDHPGLLPGTVAAVLAVLAMLLLFLRAPRAEAV